MPDFLFAYHGGGRPETPREAEQAKERWNAWLAELGSAAVNPGTPLGQSWTVGRDFVEDHGGPNPIMGFSIIRAESLEVALELAKRCPHTDFGTIEVAEVFALS